MRKLCPQCSLDGHFEDGLYVGIEPVRKSRALSAGARAHLDALEQCNSPVTHNQPRQVPCDGSSSGTRINRACKTETAFGEVLSTAVNADPFFALDVFLCGDVSEQGCARDRRGVTSDLFGDAQREMLFNPSMPRKRRAARSGKNAFAIAFTDVAATRRASVCARTQCVAARTAASS